MKTRNNKGPMRRGEGYQSGEEGRTKKVVATSIESVHIGNEEVRLTLAGSMGEGILPFAIRLNIIRRNFSKEELENGEEEYHVISQC